jgi:hypothetical protein
MTQTTHEAARIWAEAVKESGIWMEDCAEKVADFGRLIIPKMQEAIDNAKN